MDLHIETLLEQFDKAVPTLNMIKDYVMPKLNSIIHEDQRMNLCWIEGRVKNKKSLEGKLIIKGHKYKSIKDITDLVGLRVITIYSDQVDIMSSIIENLFEIDVDNSVDKRKMLEVDRFGYTSIHYICKIPKSLYNNLEYEEINNFRFEIQVRTALQHIWATAFHDTGYKSDIEVPREYIRRLARLNGLLEIADEEFLSIKNSINDYRAKVSTLVSQGKFEDLSLNIDSYENYLKLKPFDKLMDRIKNTIGIEIEPGNYIRFYKVFVELGIKKLIEIENIKEKYSDYAYKLTLSQLNGKDIDIISETVALQNILTCYIVKICESTDDMIVKLNILHREHGLSAQRAKKIIEQTKSVLI